MSAIDGFTRELIDYAGLFPPAGLDMETVVKNFAEYVKGDESTKLARIIVPASRLAEFESVAADLLPMGKADCPWRISAIVPPWDQANNEFRFAVSGIQQFNKRHQLPSNGKALVDVIEIKTPTLAHIDGTTANLPLELRAFMEIPHQEDPSDAIRKIATMKDRGRFFAKIRTGGIKAEWIPPSSEVARFIHACAENLVGLKATAGLHHPIRGSFKLTYEPDSASATMHGFVNVFVAACLAFGLSLSRDEIEAILESDSADAFVVNDEKIGWGKHFLSGVKAARIRQEFVASFGSCSFTEPTSEFVQAGFRSTYVAATS